MLDASTHVVLKGFEPMKDRQKIAPHCCCTILIFFPSLFLLGKGFALTAEQIEHTGRLALRDISDRDPRVETINKFPRYILQTKNE